MNKRIALLALLTAAIGTYFWLGLGQYFSLEFLQRAYAHISAYQAQHPWAVFLAFGIFYMACAALSIPAAGILSLLAGALFGLGLGVIVVSFASSVGATLAFLSSRFIARDAVLDKFGSKLQAVEDGFRKDGPFYLFTLRLIPVIPFVAVNLLMGLTNIRTFTFYWVSQLAMLPATFVFVNTGTQLSELRSVEGLLSPTLIGSFVLLGCFPWIARGLVAAAKKYSAR